jgi:TfoX/Sxy family transcriptional regulator of competence genes
MSWGLDLIRSDAGDLQRRRIDVAWFARKEVPMAYDADLADRIRSALSDESHVREVKMFGGLAFMVNEQMVACVGGGGGALLVRVARDRDAEYLEMPGASRAEMGEGRSMGEGWITIDEKALAEDKNVQFWIDAVLAYNAEKTKGR